jgi:hypothetical protein
MGAQRLRARTGGADTRRRRACRRVRQRPRSLRQLPRLRRRVGRLRIRAVGSLVDRPARRARDFRRGPRPGQPGVHRRHLSGRRAQPGDRRVGVGLGPDHGRGSGARRLADRDCRLAVGLRHQSAAGACRGRPHPRRRARRSAATASVRRRRRRHPGGWVGRAGLGAEPNRPHRFSRPRRHGRHLDRRGRRAGSRRDRRLRAVGAHDRASDDAAAPAGKQALRQPQRGDAVALRRARRDVFPAVVRSRRPTPTVTDRRRPRLPALHPGRRNCCRGRSAPPPTSSAPARC